MYLSHLQMQWTFLCYTENQIGSQIERCTGQCTECYTKTLELEVHRELCPPAWSLIHRHDHPTLESGLVAEGRLELSRLMVPFPSPKLSLLLLELFTARFDKKQISIKCSAILPLDISRQRL